MTHRALPRPLPALLAAAAACVLPLTAGCVLARGGGEPEGEAADRPAADGSTPSAEVLEEDGEPDERAALPEPPAAQRDYWLERFGGYMTEQQRALYLATPPAQRYERFADLLLEWQRREALLEPWRERLTPEEIAVYRRLPDLESCRTWLQQRFGEQ